MSKYPDELINAYINGEELVGYNIDILEDDYLFMIMAINKSGDKKLYNLCSDNVKSNYELVKYLIERFSDDLEYISKVADYYISKEMDDVLRLEIILIMCKFTKNKDIQKYGFYKLLAEARFSEAMFEIECMKHDNDIDKETINQIGMGFILAQEQYEEYEIISEFFAQRFIEEILWVYSLTFEKIVHEKFKSYDDLENYGATKFLIDYIAKFDFFLAEYVACHNYILDFMLEEIPRIKYNWDAFERRNEYKKYEIILDEIHEYMSIYEEECSFTEIELLIHIGKIFNITNELRKHDFLESDVYELIECRNLDECIFSINDIKHYTYIKKFVHLVLNSKLARKPSEDEILSESQHEEKSTKVKTRCRIIKFPTMNKN